MARPPRGGAYNTARRCSGRRLRRGFTFVTALALVGLACPELARADTPPPSELELGPNAQRPRVIGERPPKARAALPARLARPTAKNSTKKPPRKRAPKRAAPPHRVHRAAPVHATLLLIDAGQVSVPRTLVALGAGANHFPDLVGVSLDISFLHAATWRHAYGLRVGLLMPRVPAANWYSDAAGANPPVFTEVNLLGLDVAFEYAYRRRLIGPVGVMLRGGVGIAVAIGSLRRVETLPSCSAAATCAHWRKAGVQPNTLPSPVWPAVHATGGLFVALGDRFGLHIEAGLRDALYIGAGISLRP